MVTVQLLVFSGREDPVWTLEDADAERLRQLVEDVVGNEPADQPKEPVLGYRGFLVTIKDVPSLPSDFRVFRGALIESPEDSPRVWNDNEGVEALLLENARQRGLVSVLAAMGAP
jgi:hypothetical protein